MALQNNSSSLDAMVKVIQAHRAEVEWPRVATHCRKSMKAMKSVSDNDIKRALSALNPGDTVGVACILCASSSAVSVGTAPMLVQPGGSMIRYLHAVRHQRLHHHLHCTVPRHLTQ
jgi:hypothetical protein